MRRVAALVLLASALVACTRTARPAVTSQPAEPKIGILAIGDFGVGGERERAVGAALRRFEATITPASVLVTLGDNDYTASPERFRQEWRSSFGWLRSAGLRVVGAIGNHDFRVQRGRYEFRLLEMPAPYYQRSIGPIDFFVLDTNAIGARQTAWLRRALARSRARWKIAVFHEPAFSCGSYGSKPEVARRWVPLFERFGVELVLSGHDHNYQRFAPRRGVTYVIHGGGGQRLYPIRACPAGYARRVRARLSEGFLYLVAEERALFGAAVNFDGDFIDRFTVRNR